MHAIDAHPIPDSYWVEPQRILAGEYPGARDEGEAREKVRRILRAGVTCFVDLTVAGEGGLRPYAALAQEEAEALGRRVEHRRRPIEDLSVPTREQILAILAEIEAISAGGGVPYVHCWGGIGRTGTVVGCLLVRRGMRGEEALARIGELRRGTPDGWRRSPETQQQVEMVLGFR